MTSGLIELDLLIVGGGLEGLTLLHHWTEESEGLAALVSRDPLGAGESLHSHGYLYRGYFLGPEHASSIPQIVESFEWWNDWINRHRIHYEEDSAR